MDDIRLLLLLLIYFPATSSSQFLSVLPDNETCLDPRGIIRENGEKWFLSFICGLCSCHEGTINCTTVKIACPKAPHPLCAVIPGGCCPSYFCGKVTCKDDKGIQKRYGEVWIDGDPCKPLKCTEMGIRRTVNTCPQLPLHPIPSCQLMSDVNCCSYLVCRGNCPDPKSFGRVCVQYQDQCLKHTECGVNESCCLVARCGRECMNSCMEKNGDKSIVHQRGERWHDLNTASVMYNCMENSDDATAHEAIWNLQHVGDTDEDLTTVNYTSLVNKVLLDALRNIWPVKDFRYYLEGFRSLVSRLQAPVQTPKPVDRSAIQSFADRFNWTAVVPFLSRDNKIKTKLALDSGETSLQNHLKANKILSENSRPLDDSSPSVKHQVAFGRTDPISMQMANLGHLISKATQNLAASLHLPSSAIPALSLLGESQECTQRFGSLLRPNLAPNCDEDNPYRSFDGSCNNLDDGLVGAAFTEYRRVLPPEYGDGISAIRKATSGDPLPSARMVSSAISKKNVNSTTHTMLQMSFGQFIGHDLVATPVSRGPNGGPLTCCDDFRAKLDLAMRSLTTGKLVLEEAQSMEPSLRTNVTLAEMRTFSSLLKRLQAAGDRILGSLRSFTQATSQQPQQPPGTDDECAPIPIPKNDMFYSRFKQSCMEFARSSPAGSCKFGSREQLNQQSSYLDGSLIYGVKQETVKALRTFQNGMLKAQVTKEGQMLLPPSSQRFDGCNREPNFQRGEFCFVAGDGRVNEQILMTFHQTLWNREHNRIAKILKSLNSHWDDEKLFQEARRIVIAEIQHVTYNEYLPTVLPRFILRRMNLMPLTGSEQTTDYDSDMLADVSNVFATAAFRFGHSGVSAFIQRINNQGVQRSDELSTLFFHPFLLYEKNAMSNIARGGIAQPAGKVDTHFTEEVAGKLFRGSSPFGLDLAAINIQRGRDHGIPGYIAWREHCGLSEVNTFDDLSFEMDLDVINAMKALYSDVEDIDLYVGGMAEQAFLGGIVGPTFSCLISDQFMRIKVGDRFWYENEDSPGAFTKEQMEQLHKVSLARILCNNIPELQTIQLRPFLMKEQFNEAVPCTSPRILNYSLAPWRSQ